MSRSLLTLLMLVAVAAGVGYWLGRDGPSIAVETGGPPMGLPEGPTGAALDVHPISPLPDREPRPPLEVAPMVASLATGVLPEPVAVRGTVEDRFGRPVPGARVTLLDDDGTLASRQVAGRALDARETDEHGGFEFPRGLRPTARGLLRVEHQDLARARVGPVDPLRPSTLTQRIVLRPGGVLEGRVASETGGPLAGTVSVFELSTSLGADDTGLEREIPVDREGFYRIERLSGGRKRVRAAAPGFASVSLETTIVDGGTGSLEFRLRPGGEIFGRVVDAATGIGIADARVEAREVPRNGRGELRVESTRTDSVGGFRLRGLTLGLHVVAASSVEFGGAAPVNADASQSRELVLQLERLGTLSGWVRDRASGGGAPVFSVTLSRTPRRGAADPRRERYDDGSGRFTVRGVPPGTHWLLVDAPGSVPEVAGPFTLGLGEHVSGIQIELTPGAVVSGRVMGPDGRGVAEASVALLEELRPRKAGGVPLGAAVGDQKLQVIAVDTITLEDGSFCLGSVPLGTLQLIVRHPDFAPTGSDPLRIVGPEAVEIPDVIVRRASGLEGHVRDARGDPDPLAVVRVVPVLASAAQGPRQASTDVEGFFRLAGLVPGPYRVAVLPRAGETALPLDAGDLTTLSSGETKTIELRRR